MGTPEFAVPSLRALAERHRIQAVFTQPDRPAGRGRKLLAPPVKRAADGLGLPVFQPRSVSADEVHRTLLQAAPEAIAVVGYGQWIPKRIRRLPPLGCVNVHSSLLPKYRGAAPVSWAIVRGEQRTGVTTMRIAKAMDAGDIFLSRSITIGERETASELNRRLAPMGAELLVETLEGLAAGTLRAVPQDHRAATRAPLIRRSDGLVDWSLDSQSIYNRLRGFDPWPGIFSFFRGKRLRIHAARPGGEGGLPPGRLATENHVVSAGCGQGRLLLDEVQLEGRRRVRAADFARGVRLQAGEVLGDG